MRYRIYKEVKGEKRYCLAKDGEILEFNNLESAKKFQNIIKKFHNLSVIEEVYE